MLASEIVTAIRVKLGEPTAGFWSDANLLICANDAARQFSVESGILLSPPVSTSVVASTTGYVFPTDCAGPHMLQAVLYNGTKMTPTVPAAAMNTGNVMTTLGTPAKWYTLVDGGKIYLCLVPVPSGSVADALQVWYSKICATMEIDTESDPAVDSTCDIPEAFCEAVISLAAANAFTMKQDEKSMSIAMAKYEDWLAMAQSYISATIAAGMKDVNGFASDSHSVF